MKIVINCESDTGNTCIVSLDAAVYDCIVVVLHSIPEACTLTVVTPFVISYKVRRYLRGYLYSTKYLWTNAVLSLLKNLDFPCTVYIVFVFLTVENTQTNPNKRLLNTFDLNFNEIIYRFWCFNCKYVGIYTHTIFKMKMISVLLLCFSI